MALWDTVKARFDRQAPGIAHVVLPDDGPPIMPYGGYFRLWLQEMRLARSTSWGKESFPAAHSEVRVRTAGSEPQAYATLSRPSEDALGQGVWTGYQLTELMPYNGGTVEVEAALLTLPGRDSLGPALDAIGQLAGLLIPPVGQALPLARAVAEGARGLLGRYETGVHVGLHHTLVADGGGVASATMRAGWIAVVRGAVDAQRLTVAGDRLCHGDVPLEAADFVLLRIEARVERPDWRLPEIDAPLKRALNALSDGAVSSASGYRSVALAAARESSALAEDDRPRVIQAIKDAYARVESGGRGATGASLPGLDTAMQRFAMPREQALALGPLDDEALFG